MYNYLEKLYIASPASTIKMKVERPLPNSLPSFDKTYNCLHACKRRFLAGYGKIIGLDRCFLKGLMKGELLCTVGKDAINQIYLIAWAFVRIENKD